MRARRHHARRAARAARRSPAPRKAAPPAIAAPAAITLDDRLVCSCLMLAVEAEGHEIRTIEGMAQGEKLHPLQQKFLEMAALQCGICTSGMLVASDALLEEEPEPERGGSPLLARRQPLPVHRLRQDRPRGDGNRRRNARAIEAGSQPNEHRHRQQVDRPAHHPSRRHGQGHRPRRSSPPTPPCPA